MTLFPRKPALTTWGAYDTIDLARYFEEADRAKMGEAQIARQLGVDVHRVIFMRGRDGQSIQERRMLMLAECRP